MDTLEQARAEIDAVDAQLAALFERRMAAVLSVAQYKQAHGLPIFDAAREAVVLEKAAARIQNAALRPYYKDHVQNMMDVAKQYEAEVLGRNRAAYQGVEGAFAHIALRALFPHAEAVSCPTWDEVFDAVSRGDTAHGVVPFENSHAGDVSAVLDLCYNHPELWVVDVYDLPISQNLLVLPGTQLAQLRHVYSHQQAIAQSETFLKQFHLPATAILADITSVKVRPLQQMEAIWPGPVVGTHPLFGPATPDEDGLPVTVTPGRTAREEDTALVEAFFRALGCSTFRATADEHDRAMARVQNMNFITNLAYFALLAGQEDLLPYITPSFRRRLHAAEKMLTEDGTMFTGLFEANPYSHEAVRQYRKMLNVAAAGDIELLCRRAQWWWKK